MKVRYVVNMCQRTIELHKEKSHSIKENAAAGVKKLKLKMLVMG